MTEIVFTPTGPKVASNRDTGSRFYRKNEVDAWKNRMFVGRFKELTANVASNSNCNVQVIAQGPRGAMKLFFMNTETSKIVEVM